jgi:hypothetical protein
MNATHKKFFLTTMSFFLLAGMTISIPNKQLSVTRGDEPETRILVRNDVFQSPTSSAITANDILPYSHSNFTTYFTTLLRVNLTHTLTLPAGNLTSGNTNNLPISPSLISKIYVTISAFGNNATTSPNYTVQAIDNDSNNISGVSQTLQMHNQSVSTVSAAITAAESNPKEFMLISTTTLISGLKITYSSGNGGTPGSLLYRIKIEYVESTSAAEDYSTEFLSFTNNKENLCTFEDLNWSILDTNYNSLSESSKNYFKTNTTNSTIVSARERYLYLRSFNPDLPNFAGL